jgi:hypothetical protein
MNEAGTGMVSFAFYFYGARQGARLLREELGPQKAYRRSDPGLDYTIPLGLAVGAMLKS